MQSLFYNRRKILGRSCFITSETKKITLSAIEAIRVGPKCIELKSCDFKEGTQMFIMTKKNKNAFIETIKQHKSFKATIIDDPELTISKHY